RRHTSFSRDWSSDVCSSDLAPFKYPWAWKYFLNANKNHWTPLDINMTQDVHDYHKKLTEDEQHVYQNVLSYLTTSDILAMRNIEIGRASCRERSWNRESVGW